MKKLLFLIFFLILIGNSCLSLPMDTITAIYDCKTKTLTIQNYNLCLFNKAVDRFPNKIIDYFPFYGDSAKLEKGTYVITSITEEELADYKTITVYFRDKQDKWTQRCNIEIQFINQVTDSSTAKDISSRKFLYISIAFGSIALLLLFFLWIRKRGKQKEEEKINSNPVIQIIEEEKNIYQKGLDHIHQDSGNYFVLNMEEFTRDTAVKKVYLSREVIKKINSYFKEFLEHPDRTNETGCYLIGCWEIADGKQELYNISIEEIVIPGDDAIYDEYSLNFGLTIGIKLGSEIQNRCEKSGRDYVHTAWMHSHPGLGLFLSSHDLIVQKQLTYEDAPKRMIAVVIDTNTPDWQMAIFSSKTNGSMNNKEDLLKTISFDVLNDWSRQKSTESTYPLSFDNTYLVASEDSKVRYALSAKIINQIDDLAYTENADHSFYCHGEHHQIGDQHTWMVNTCGNTKQDNSIGRLFLSKENANPINTQQYTELTSDNEIGLVLNPNEKMTIFCKDSDNEIQIIQASLKDMKEWTRRKRK